MAMSAAQPDTSETGGDVTVTFRQLHCIHCCCPDTSPVVGLMQPAASWPTHCWTGPPNPPQDPHSASTGACRQRIPLQKAHAACPAPHVGGPPLTRVTVPLHSDPVAAYKPGRRDAPAQPRGPARPRPPPPQARLPPPTPAFPPPFAPPPGPFAFMPAPGALPYGAPPGLVTWRTKPSPASASVIMGPALRAGTAATGTCHKVLQQHHHHYRLKITVARHLQSVRCGQWTSPRSMRQLGACRAEEVRRWCAGAAAAVHATRGAARAAAAAASSTPAAAPAWRSATRASTAPLLAAEALGPPGALGIPE